MPVVAVRRSASGRPARPPAAGGVNSTVLPAVATLDAGPQQVGPARRGASSLSTGSHRRRAAANRFTGSPPGHTLRCSGRRMTRSLQVQWPRAPGDCVDRLVPMRLKSPSVRLGSRPELRRSEDDEQWCADQPAQQTLRRPGGCHSSASRNIAEVRRSSSAPSCRRGVSRGSATSSAVRRGTTAAESARFCCRRASRAHRNAVWAGVGFQRQRPCHQLRVLGKHSPWPTALMPPEASSVPTTAWVAASAPARPDPRATRHGCRP